MDKSEVYSWRLSPAVKAALEEAARRERQSMAALLDRIVRGWLAAAQPSADADAERHVRTRARRCFGAIGGGNPNRSASLNTIFTVDRADFETYRLDRGRRFRVVPARLS